MSKIRSLVGSRISSVGALAFRSKTNSVDLLSFDPADNRVRIDKLLGFGVLEAAPTLSGVLTVTKSFVNPQPESGTSDTVDSIVMTGVEEGDILVCFIPATNTMTFDNSSTLKLGAGTRAVAPGGNLVLAYHGTSWWEIHFLAASS